MTKERKVGLILLIVGIFAVMCAIAIMTARESSHLHYTVIFDAAEGLKKGDRVQLKGVDIGVVEWVELHTQPSSVSVRLKIDPEHTEKIRDDSTAMIQNVAFLNVSGTKVVNIELTESEPPAEPMPEDAIVYGLNSLIEFKTWQLKQKFKGGADLIKSKMGRMDEYAKNLRSRLDELNIGDQVKEAFVALQGFLKTMKDKGIEALDQLEAEWPQVKAKVEPLIKQVQEFGQTQLVAQIKQIMSQIEGILASWRKQTDEETQPETPEATQPEPTATSQ